MLPLLNIKLRSTQIGALLATCLILMSCSDTKKLNAYKIKGQPLYQNDPLCEAQKKAVETTEVKPCDLVCLVLREANDSARKHLCDSICLVLRKDKAPSTDSPCDPQKSPLSKRKMLANVKIDDKAGPHAFVHVSEVRMLDEKYPKDTSMTESELIKDVAFKNKELSDDTIVKVETSVIREAIYPPRQLGFEKADHCGNKGIRNVGYIYSGKRFWYRQETYLLQAVTIPAKLRFPVDSLDFTGQTNVSFGLAFGWKHTWNSFKNFYSCKTAGYINHKTSKITAAWGVFGAPTGQDLNAENTRGGYKGNRTALGISFGAFAAAEVAKVTLGVAGGFDHPLGPGAKDWIYRGQPWVGLIIGISMFEGKG